MFFGLFKKHCPICGQDVEKDTAAKRFGKYFCSEEHAGEHRQKLASEEANAKKHGGGCC